MKVKEVEKAILDYLQDNHEYYHKEKALNEFDNVRTKFKLDDLVHIGFIVNDYPNYDHCLFHLTDDKNFFIKFGLSREYLKSLDKNDIHKIAKGLCSLFKYNALSTKGKN